MTIGAHAEHFAGKLVRDFEPGKPLRLSEAAYRLSVNYEEFEEGATILDRIAAYLADPNAVQTDTLVFGQWHGDDSSTDSSGIVEALVTARQKLPKLRALFIGDITYEENEISWITQSDLSPLFVAFPNLEHFKVRGGSSLAVGKMSLPGLKSLVVESGGLDRSVVQDICTSPLPALEHLEIWLGIENYGGTCTLDDLQPILSGKLFPNLKYLGLMDSEAQDEIAAAAAQAPIVSRLETLDLSMGTLSDEGGKALLASPAIAKLKSLDLHHHYLSDEVMEQLQKLGPDVNLDGAESADSPDDRYVAVGE